MSAATQTVAYTPKVFVVKKSLNKVALTDNYLDCRKYISRSGLTFDGCYEYYAGSLREARGIYYLKAPELVKFETRRKMSRDIYVTKDITMKILSLAYSLEDLGLPEPLLISYDNNMIYVYDKYVKGRMLDFPLYCIHSTPGRSILVENIANTQLKITLTSQGHDTTDVTTDAKWLLFDHPRPSRGFYD